MIYGIWKHLTVLMLIWVSACTTAGVVNPSSVQASAATTDTYTIGDREIKIITTRYGGGRFMLVALHENESTSVAAARAVLRQHGGVLVELKHGGQRNVSFALAGKSYKFDPNRIFTDAGLRRTLQGGGNPEAVALVKGLADFILKKLGSGPIVSLHNNTEGSYSIRSYQTGGQYARDATMVNVAPGVDSDDFFFVTHASLFELMKTAGYNAALQSRSATDDGSLSIWAQRNGRPYINVEAQNGHAAYQVEMIEAVLAQ